MTEISIIVPVYNIEHLLPKCVDSILAQSFTDFEVILVDDGSTDKSGEICDRYANLDKRVKVIHKKKWWNCIFTKCRFRGCKRKIYRVCR